MTSVRAPPLFSFALPMRLLSAEYATRRYLPPFDPFVFVLVLVCKKMRNPSGANGRMLDVHIWIRSFFFL